MYEAKVNVSGLVPQSGTSRSFVTHKLTEGDNIFRFLPPFGTNHKGLPFAQVSLHWFTTLDSETGKDRQRPLRCSYYEEKFCPVCSEANELYNEKESLIKEFKNTETNKINWDAVPEDVNAKYKQLNANFSALKSRPGFYYNALDASGTVGILRLPKTAATKLGELLQKAINTYGFNPLSLEKGATFNIIQKKTGPKAFNVEYSVEFVTKSTTGPNGVQLSIELTPAPANVIENFETLAYDVHAMYPIMTAAELKRAMLGDAALWNEVDAKKKAVAEESKASKAEVTAASSVTVATQGAIKPTVVPATTSVETPVVAITPAVSINAESSPESLKTTLTQTAMLSSEEDAELAKLRAELKV